MSWIFPAVAMAFMPKQGVVPDAKTAVNIAEAVAFPIYGEQTIKDDCRLKRFFLMASGS